MQVELRAGCSNAYQMLQPSRQKDLETKLHQIGLVQLFDGTRRWISKTTWASARPHKLRDLKDISRRFGVLLHGVRAMCQSVQKSLEYNVRFALQELAAHQESIRFVATSHAGNTCYIES